MSQIVETPTRMFPAGAAIAANLRVKLSSGKLAAAGITDIELGTLDRRAAADGDLAAVRLRTAQGTCKMVAAKAITLGAPVYTAASGKISDAAAATSYRIGDALEAATADGDVIEVLRLNGSDSAQSG